MTAKILFYDEHGPKEEVINNATVSIEGECAHVKGSNGTLIVPLNRTIKIHLS